MCDLRLDLADIAAQQLAGLDVSVCDGLSEAVYGSEFVQEAGPERIATAAAHTGEDVVLASSSSLLPSAIADGNRAAHRIVIGHQFNPPEVLPLVEVVPSAQTSEATVERAVEAYRGLGKVPVRLKKEIPGYVGNRSD